MGEYAEMMLDGTMCAGCGEYMGGGEGFPGYCSKECAQETGGYFGGDKPFYPRHPKVDPCPVCMKKLRGMEGVKQHLRDVHKLRKPQIDLLLDGEQS